MRRSQQNVTNRHSSNSYDSRDRRGTNPSNRSSKSSHHNYDNNSELTGLNTFVSENCVSPTSWICDVGNDAFRPCFNSDASVSSSKGKKSPSQSKKSSKIIRHTRSSKSPLRHDDDDDDDMDTEVILNRLALNRREKKSNKDILYERERETQREREKERERDRDRTISPLTPDSALTTNITTLKTTVTDSSDVNTRVIENRDESYRTDTRIRSHKPLSKKSVESTGEPKIIAPNVSKLSLMSVIEVRLQSAGECVTVQCSVDVLKMQVILTFLINLDSMIL